MAGTYSPLGEAERDLNNIYIMNILLNVCPNPSSAQQKQKDEIHKAILAFTEEHCITLDNLEHNEGRDEGQQLVGIIEGALQKGAVSKETLESWKEGLTHAVAGQGDHIVRHATQEKSIADCLLQGRMVSADKWGTDDDARCYFKNRITAPHNIKEAGLFILPPVSLTESDGAALKGVLEEVKDAIGKEKITGPVNLLILANDSNKHWVTLKIGIEEQTIRAKVWDSLQYECDVMGKPAFMALKNGLKVFHKDKYTVLDPIYQAKGVQHDSHSCLYHCLAEMEGCLLKGSLEDLDPSSHQEGDQLRFAVVEKIVKNHEGEGLRGKTVELQSNGTILLSPPIPEVSPVAETENVPMSSKESPLDQVNGRAVAENHSSSPTTEPSPASSSTSSSTDAQGEVDQLSKIIERLDGIVRKGNEADEFERNWQLDFDLAIGIELDRLFMQAKGSVDEKALFENARKQAARQVGLFSGGYQRKIKYKTEETSPPPSPPSPKG